MMTKTRLWLVMAATLLAVVGFGSLLIAAFIVFLGFGWQVAAAAILLYLFVQWFISPIVVRRSVPLRYLDSCELPWLADMVDDFSAKAGIPKPRLAIVADDSPNAFVYGRTRGGAVLTVTAGLLSLPRHEVRAVVGHEIGHIKNFDCVILTFVSSIPLLFYTFSMTFIHEASASSGRGLASMVFALVFYLAGMALHLVYFLTYLATLNLSRSREFLADAYSSKLTGSPADLKSALAHICYGLSVKPSREVGVRAFCINDPVKARSDVRSLVDGRMVYDLDGDGRLDERERQIAMLDLYDLNRDGRLDEREIELAMRMKTAGFISRLHELLSTHPATHRRMQSLDALAGKHPATVEST